MKMDKENDTSVQVAVRIRPQLANEKIDMCRVCTNVIASERQVVLGTDKTFTFDYVYDMDILQKDIYDSCAAELVNGTFEGLNATILAYGQTGSGKTYTMGTSFDLNIEEKQVGIIPRAMEHLFGDIADRRQKALDSGETPPDFKVNAQFMEIYNEEIFDLLDATRDPAEKMRKSHIKIHEDARGGIYIVGLTTRPVNSLQDTIQCLKTGTLSRTTASTNMNAQSSRSHAIFMLHVRQQRIFKAELTEGETEAKGDENKSVMKQEIQELETLTAKFNFVDLAGSERLKRTGATGDRAKEGISINCGLLALGNVISALGDIEKRGCHVPYRDSKLTRLLQDSLGGNSRTTMIACISPSDRDFMETLNTLKYANRARNIRNKVVVNQDLASSQLSALRAEIQALHRELNDYRMGRKVADGECANDLFQENQTLQNENESLRQRVKALQLTVDTMTSRNAQLQAEKEMFSITGGKDSCTDEDMKKFLEGYAMQIEQLRSKLTESEALVESMKLSAQHRSAMTSGRASRAFDSSFSGVMSSSLDFNEDPDDHIRLILDEAKKDLMSSIKSIQQAEKSENEEGETDKLKEGTESGKTGAAEEEEGTEDEEDSESESENECGQLEESLADLTCEISIKQKLIDELEMSQKRLRSLKMQYEEKLNALENRIRQTEQERDCVLATLGGTESQKEGKAKKVREEYDLKLTSMQGELKKLHAAKREHAKLMRNQTHYETQLQTLQRDLADLKKMKVKLMRQLQEEAQKTRQIELRRQKEVAQLKKQERVKDNKIKTLETEKKKKETILKRKLEEVEALRRRQKQTMSRQVAVRVSRYPRSSASAASQRQLDVESVDPRMLKTSWDNLEKLIGSIITKRQTLAHLDKDMERWIKQREIIGKKLEKFLKRQEKSMAESVDGTEVVNPELNDQIECLRDNLSYIQENINECQNCIVRLEEMKVDDVDPANILASCSFMEAVYLLEHCTSLAINKGLLAAQKDDECRELVAKLHQEQMESIFQRDMLQYLIQDKVDVEIDNGIIWQDKDVESDDDSIDSISPTDSLEVQFQGEAARLDLDLPQHDGMVAGLETEELCLPVPHHLTKSSSSMSLDSLIVAPAADKNKDAKNLEQEQKQEQTVTKESMEASSTTQATSTVKSNRPTGLSVMSDKHPRKSPASPSPARRPASAATKTASPAVKGKNAKLSTAASPPGPLKRQTSTGVINAAVPSTSAKDFALVHSHTAVGHSKAVLSVYASDSTLYSSSKDRTAKLWDLSTGVEILTLDGHPNNVVSVKFSEATSLVFTASAYLVKIWDARSGKNCLNTLTSAGMIGDSCAIFDDVSSRPISCPPGEINVTDIAVNNAGTMLYTAAGNTVRLWDMKMMRSVGKLFGGNQAAVMAMAVCESGSSGSSCVVTGSKDKCIKVFQVGRDCSGILNPRCSLEPTHSDGIESLCIVGGTTLYSGARDMCIKSWDLAEGRLKQSITTAHRDWICGLALVPRGPSPGGGVLVSACRAGMLRTWSLANSTFLGELQAHVGPINSICTNSSLVFTGSTDRSIRLWRQKAD